MARQEKKSNPEEDLIKKASQMLKNWNDPTRGSSQASNLAKPKTWECAVMFSLASTERG